MAKTIGRYGKKLSLTEHKNRIKRANNSKDAKTRSYTNYYYKDYKRSGGKLSLNDVLDGK